MGVSIYFKQLKSLICLFFIFSLISVPSFILYYYGGDTTTVKDSKTLFSTFTLGNIGQTERVCSQSTYENAHVKLFCGYGVIDELSLLTLTDMQDTKCSSSDIENTVKNYREECNMSEDSNALDYFKK